VAKKDQTKTNVMRILEQRKIPYAAHTYPHGNEAVDGLTVAALTGMDPERVFKTLVARGASKTPYVFVIPVAKELDLKRAAKAVGEKSISMLHVSELTPLTGYVRGGCSPIGMKKQFTTGLDDSALLHDTIVVSAGRIGVQAELAPGALCDLICGSFAPLTED
jgi:Cys-tRNA(Pro)/Cys-tRNA(Cys) deacylase